MIFAWHGSDNFQQFMGQELNELSIKVKEILGKNLISLILGGGYGRSEGGIIIQNGLEKPYNDLDMVLVVNELNQDFANLLLPVRKEWSKRLGIHVDFSRPLTLKQLKSLPHKLMWQDLLFGHIILCGEKEVLRENMPAKLKEPLPVIEASHLLLNRGAGLIWSFQILHGITREDDNDFVRRNYFKAALAIGDALLIAYQMHQTKYFGRDLRLKNLSSQQTLPEILTIMPLYERALKFKFSPDEEKNFSADLDKIKDLARLLILNFLHVETLRSGKNFRTAADYQAWHGIRQPEEHSLAKIPRNIFQNIRRKRFSPVYPREFLYRKMPSILENAANPSKSWVKASMDFLELWNRFN